MLTQEELQGLASLIGRPVSMVEQMWAQSLVDREIALAQLPPAPPFTQRVNEDALAALVANDEQSRKDVQDDEDTEDVSGAGPDGADAAGSV